MKPTKPDPILDDIQRAVKGGYFDDWQPSELLATPVEEIQGRVAMMSDAGRRKYLESIGHQGGAAESPGVFGLPADDQIRYADPAVDDGYEPGELLTEVDFAKKLDSVIESWPTWSSSRPRVAAERVKGWLSKPGQAGAKQQGKWLSR